jgi:Tat protein secretion system quality control protein TatD with DNase activity
MFIDTHSHPYTEEFDDDREAVIARAREAGAEMILLPNINEASVGPMLELCEKHPDFCRPMMGLHPTELPGTAEEVETALNHMERLLEAPNHPYIAIGEVGIDLYWDSTYRKELHELIRQHYLYTGSKLARTMLDDWNHYVEDFIQVVPIEYKRVLQEEQVKKLQQKIADMQRDY